MKLGRLTAWLSFAAVVTLVAVGALVAVGWTPMPTGVSLNADATSTGQGTHAWMGFTPFTDQAASIGLVIAAMGVILMLSWSAFGLAFRQNTERLSQMLPEYRSMTPQPTLLDLVEHLVEVQKRQHAEIMRRLEVLERASTIRQVEVTTARAADLEDEVAYVPLDQRDQGVGAPPAPRGEPTAMIASFDATAGQRINALEAAYRDLLTNPTPGDFRAFFNAHAAWPVERRGDRFGPASDPDALLSAMPTGGETLAVLPGYELVSDFGTLYYRQLSMPDEARLVFDFDVDGSRVLKLDAAGRGRRASDGSFVVEDRGRLAGFVA